MNKRLAVVIYAALLMLSPGCWTSRQASILYSVTIPSEQLMPHLQDGNRITEYNIKFTGGHLYGLVKIFDDWSVDVWPTVEVHQVDAGAGHGASWLTLDDVRDGAFRDFMVINKYDHAGIIHIVAEFTIYIQREDMDKHIRLEGNAIIVTPYL